MATYLSPTDVSPGSKIKSADINNIDAATAAAFALLPTNAKINAGTVNYAVDTGTADVYLVALPMTATSYVDGLSVVMKPLNANTGACTINIDSLGAKSIKTEASGTPAANDIVVGVPVELRYSSTTGYFHIIKNSASAAAAAAASQAAASGSAAAALVSQNAASGSAAAALISKGAASASEAAASASEDAASVSETTASAAAATATTKAGEASISAAAALVSQNAAAAAYDSFDDRYLGAKATDPTADNDGNALITGALYFNTALSLMKVYSGSAWNSLSLAIVTAGATTEILVGGGSGVSPVWTTATGSGAPVRATSPTLVTPTLGAAMATSINKVVITAPATSATITIADGVTLTVPLGASVSGTNTGDQTVIDLTAKTSSGTLSAAELSGNVVITNTGAAGAIELTLQAGAADLALRVIVTVAQYLRITAAGTDKFRYGTVEGAAGGNIESDVVGTSFMLIWSGANWCIMDLVGILNYSE